MVGIEKIRTKGRAKKDTGRMTPAAIASDQAATIRTARILRVL
jgi:hypothetical protein